MNYANIPAAQLRKGAIIKVISSLALGSAVIFIRFAYAAGVLPGMAIFLRFFIAALVMTLFLTLTRRWTPLPLHRIAIIFGLGLCGYTIMGTTWFVALSLIPAWLVSLVAAFSPLAINLGSWCFFKERIPAQQLVALAAAFCGSLLLFLQPFTGAVWGGIGLMVLNVLAVAGYILVGQRWMRGIPPLTSTTYTIWGAAVGTLAYALITGQFSVDFAPVGWLWIFCFAVISTALGVMTLWWSIDLIGASRASIIGSFEVLYSMLLAVLLLGERMSPLQVAGGGFILLGMFLVQWQPRRLATRRLHAD